MPGDGICADAISDCTLRAAVTEANSNVDADVIGFDAAYTIATTTGFHLTDVATIDGSTVPGYAGTPLVRVVAAPSVLRTFQITGTANGSIIDALNITGPAETHVYFATNGTVKRSYIGAVTGGLGETGATKNGIFVASPTVEVMDCVIGGNTGEGIVVFGFTNINGCIIGLRPDGVTPAPNTLHGIYVASSASIGGTSRNIISANGVDGINSELGTPAMSANGPLIRGNYIGTDITGLLDRGNGRHGVLMNGDHTLVEGNVISGNAEHGVLSNLPTRHILAFIEGNIIGLGADGSTLIPNGLDGVHLTGNNIHIGGSPAATKRNVISGNTRAGIYIDAGSVAHSINNNYIGTDITGAVDRGNLQEGIYSVGRVLMGGNVISGNDGLAGVAILDPGWASLAGNIIGLNAAGNFPVPNSNDGLVITSSDSLGVRVGGDFEGAKNVISGNLGSGVTVSGQNAQISSSFIGTDITGIFAYPNGAHGVQLSTGASNVTVGGTTPLTRNIISGNANDGVRISSTAGNFVQGNHIGADVGGTNALPNAGDGVEIEGNASSNNSIGGSAAGAGNLIAGNNSNGIRVNVTNTTNLSIQGNIIGTPVIPNGASGILFEGGDGSAVGGTAAGESNTISGNGGAGITVDTSAVGILISGNSISSNTGLGIDLLPPVGITPNDAGDPDTGGNTLQNFPVLTAAYLYPGPTGRVLGTLNSTPGTTFTVEFFGDFSGDPEGANYLGSTVVTTDGSGNATFDATLTTAPSAGQIITATATNPANNTSEFSADIAVTEPGVLSFDTATYPIGEAGPSVIVNVNRTGGSDGTVTVIATPGGGTAETTDYDATPQTLTFGPGVTSQTLTVAITDDTLDETDETFDITLGTFTGGAIAGTPASVAVTIFDNDATPAISIQDISASEADANVTFTITLTNPSESAVTVNYATGGGTATAGVDYTTTSGTATVAAGDLTTTISVPILADTTFEDDETFNLTLASPGNATIGDDTAVGTITNDDPTPAASIDDPTVTEADAGTVTLTFTVTLSNASINPVNVNYATDGGTATPGADYTGTSGTLTFNPGIVSQTIDITVLSDDIHEGDETIVVTLSETTVVDGSGTGTINDDDPPPGIDIDDVAAGEGDSGSVPATFTVTLSSPSAFEITVDYATGGGTATAGTDYTAASDTLVFAPGETSKPLSVSVLGDTITESNETFVVTLSNATGSSIVDETGEGTITDDESAPAISIAGTSASESAANLVFTVTLSNASAQNVSVDYSTAGVTATAGADFTSTSSTLTIDAGLLSGTINVPILADSTFEPDETLTVTLANPTNGTISAGTGTGTITNDDPQPSISIAPTSASETAANLVFTVTLSNPSSQDVSFSYSTASGTATGGADYITVVGTFTVSAGLTSVPITIPILADTIFEPDETMTVALTDPVNATIATGTATGTITNDDLQPSISIDDPSAGEGDSGSTNLVFALTLSNASAQTITVDWSTSDGTATAGSDYTAASGMVTFTPGTTTQPVAIAILGDTITEPNETLNVTLANPLNATVADGSGTGTIVDDETQPAISILDAAANEGDGTITLTVTLSNASTLPVTVDWSTGGGSGTAGPDYTAASGTVTFDPGVTSQTIVITLASDNTFESDETFTVTLANATNAFIADASATATIEDDDPQPAISIAGTTAGEGSGQLAFTVTLSNPSATPVTVDWATGGGTATAGVDYTAAAGTLTFPAGTTVLSINITLVNDSSDEADETVQVTLTNPAGATLAVATANGTIVDNDAAAAASDIPTLSQWMLVLMAAFLVVAAVKTLR